MRSKRHFLVNAGLLFLVLTPIYSHAANEDAALRVDDLLPDDKKWRITATLFYGNSNTTEFLTGTAFKEVQNQDNFFGSLSMRYGITRTTEIFARVSGDYEYARSYVPDVDPSSPFITESSSSNFYFNDFSVGVNQQIFPEKKWPALFGFGELAVVEYTRFDGETDVKYARSFQVGMTTFKTYDPVVLTANVSYTHQFNRALNGIDHKFGNIFSLEPSVGFVVNPKISLSTGLLIRVIGATKVDGTQTNRTVTITSLNLGMGWNVNRRLTLLFNAIGDISGNTGSQVGVSAIYNLGRQKQPSSVLPLSDEPENPALE